MCYLLDFLNCLLIILSSFTWADRSSRSLVTSFTLSSKSSRSSTTSSYWAFSSAFSSVQPRRTTRLALSMLRLAGLVIWISTICSLQLDLTMQQLPTNSLNRPIACYHGRLRAAIRPIISLSTQLCRAGLSRLSQSIWTAQKGRVTAPQIVQLHRFGPLRLLNLKTSQVPGSVTARSGLVSGLMMWKHKRNYGRFVTVYRLYIFFLSHCTEWMNDLVWLLIRKLISKRSGIILIIMQLVQSTRCYQLIWMVEKDQYEEYQTKNVKPYMFVVIVSLFWQHVAMMINWL